MPDWNGLVVWSLDSGCCGSQQSARVEHCRRKGGHKVTTVTLPIPENYHKKNSKRDTWDSLRVVDVEANV